MEEASNIANEQDEIFKPHLKKAKNIILGQERPSFITQLTFYVSITTASIHLLWSIITLGILTFPNYLKKNKGVDVTAILEIRARDLGKTGEDFIQQIFNFQLLSIAIWTTILVTSFFIWRNKSWSSKLTLFLLILFILSMLMFLGTQYFMEDTTTFDKSSFAILILLCLIHCLVVKKQSTVMSK